MKAVMFHDVEDINHCLCPDRILGIQGLLTTDCFNTKLKFIQNNYHIKRVENYENKDYDIKSCLLTFDDGLKSHYKNVFPVLKKEKLSALFLMSGIPIKEKKACNAHKVQFINFSRDRRRVVEFLLDSFTPEEKESLWHEFSETSHVNNLFNSEQVFIKNFLEKKATQELIDNSFYEFVLKEKGLLSEADFVDSFYLNEKEIKTMYQNGMEIGGHGYYHESEKDNEKSIITLKTMFNAMGLDMNYYSYPNGVVNKSPIVSANVKVAFTTENRGIVHNDNPIELPRVPCQNINQKEKIVICGIQQQGMDICKHLINNGISIDTIVTIKKDLALSHQASGWVCYKDFCKKMGIKLYYAKSYNLKKDQNFFEKNGFSLLLLGGWQRLIPKEVLDNLNFGAIGQHGSSFPLPKGRGRSPLNWSLIENQKQIIWNIFKLTSGIDSGPIINSKEFDITPWDDINSLYYKVSMVVKQMYLESIPKILDNSIKTISQIGTPTFYSKRSPSDSRINWNKNVLDIYNLTRAVKKPYPSAFTFNGIQKITINNCKPFDFCLQNSNSKNGEIIEIFGDDIIVKCCDGLICFEKDSLQTLNKGDVLV